MQLVVDIGNTETVLGLMDSAVGEVKHHWRLTTGTARTADEFDHMVHSLLSRKGVDAAKLDRAVLGSVVPSINGRVRAALEGLISGPVFLVEPGADLPVTLDVEEPQTVGADRIVNTLAAKVLFKRDTIVVDLGTATTFDCITADGVFMGGVIAPGVQVGMEWLGMRAAKLPRVQFRPPDRVIGRRTETCMESGVFFSTVDAIDGLVGRIQREWERPDALVVATGGYAELMARYCNSVSKVEPFLTLKGLYFAGDYLAAER
ncbi:MAG: type III pantothenate kinase [Gemmatimonadetes bacterium]|nr:type III pantothenate kinase [Gemmatimonadota bacterium]